MMCSKSQLAIEFCYRLRNRSPEVWTFWVHASSAARFDADIRKLACDAGIPGCDDPKSDAFALVYSWLRDKRNGKWVLVLDNVDDPDFLFRTPDVNDESGSDEKVLRNRMAYLPPCAHGSTLITSRSRAATSRLTDECDVIAVNPMEEATALALLENKLAQSSAKEDMQKLAAALDHMPLALAQAGAYIKQRGSRYSVGRYLARLEKSEKSRTSLLTSAGKELRRDEEAQDSIILTWQISFDHIRATRPSAADLLSLMSMYNYQGIPEYLLRTRGSDSRLDTRLVSRSDGLERDSGANSSASDDEDSEEDEFGDDILTLENFHFISTTFSNTTFEMHRLVQLAARVWLRSHGMYEEWAQRSVECLDETLPTGEHENWGRCGELYPHVTSTLHQVDRESSLSQASVQYKAAWYDWRRGLLYKAEALVAKSYNTRETMLGLEDEETLSALDLYASVLSGQGKYAEAKETNRQVLKGFEKVLGKEHPNTLNSVNNLAIVLQAQGDYKAAEEHYRRALEGWGKVLGEEHPNTLNGVNNLAAVLQAQGNYKPAEEHHRRALEGYEKILGEEHPNTLTSVNNLALVLQDQGNYKAAEEHHRRTLEGWEKVLGGEHPNTLTSVNNLALVLRAQGNYKAAEEHHRRALEGYEKALGEEHPDTLTSVNNLAAVLQAQGDYKAAEEHLRRALEGREKILGEEHPDTLTSVNNLALVLQDQGNYKPAEEQLRRALEGYEKVLGKEHPDTLTSVNNLAAVLQAQGDSKAAEEHLRRALEGWEKVLGEEHPDTLTSVNNLAAVLQDQGDYKAAEEHYRRALEGRKKVLGGEHPNTLMSVNNLALVLRAQGNYKAAEEHRRRALESREKVLGKIILTR
jgi:tetratricopeptide (TPR) repeat protein